AIAETNAEILAALGLDDLETLDSRLEQQQQRQTRFDAFVARVRSTEKTALPAMLRERNRELWRSFFVEFLLPLWRRHGVSVEEMKAHNPAFVLRNWIAQEAIDHAEMGDYGKLRQVLRLLESPFDDLPQEVAEHYDRPPSGDACRLRVSCSS
ncbi:MAG: hypothetical protein MHM6MM_007722, partial [Cercozoa sp. M6MM]